jgi:hypothetical protein
MFSLWTLSARSALQGSLKKPPKEAMSRRHLKLFLDAVDSLRLSRLRANPYLAAERMEHLGEVEGTAIALAQAFPDVSKEQWLENFTAFQPPTHY